MHTPIHKFYAIIHFSLSLSHHTYMHTHAHIHVHTHYSQFITDKFLYNQREAMHLLIQCGLKDQLFELAKTHRKLDEVLELLTQYGSLEIDPSIQSSLANRQFAEVLSNTANGEWSGCSQQYHTCSCLVTRH